MTTLANLKAAAERQIERVTSPTYGSLNAEGRDALELAQFVAGLLDTTDGPWWASGVEGYVRVASRLRNMSATSARRFAADLLRAAEQAEGGA